MHQPLTAQEAVELLPRLDRMERIQLASDALRALGVPCTCPETGGWKCPRELLVDQLIGPRHGDDLDYLESRRPHRTPPKARIPALLRTAVYERDAYRCVTCGTWNDLSIDHVIPESKGGPTTLDNLQTMCRSHNSRKGTRT